MSASPNPSLDTHSTASSHANSAPFHHSSSTLAPSTSAPSHLNTSASFERDRGGSRSVSNPSSSSYVRNGLPGINPRPRRTGGGGGFLLDGGSGRSSLERVQASSEQMHERDWAHHFAEVSGIPTGCQAPETERRAVNEDEDTLEALGMQAAETDPARIVSLALNISENRRRSAKGRNSAVGAINAPGAGARYTRSLAPGPLSPPIYREAGGRGRATSPTRSFLILDKRRSVSVASAPVGRYLSPLNPSASPPVPPLGGRPSPALVPSSLPSFPYQNPQRKRGSMGQQQLRELQNQYKFTEATLQRTLKAKKVLELSALHKKLLEIQPPCPSQDSYNSNGGGRVYNPLQTIRNRRARNREKKQVDLAPWEDPGAVEQWIEDVAVSISSPGGLERGLPPPPQRVGEEKKMRRPKMEWMVTPQELLADAYWVEEQATRKRGAMEKSGRDRKSVDHPRNEGNSHMDPAGRKKDSLEIGGRSGSRIKRRKRFGGDTPGEESEEGKSRNSSRRRAKAGTTDYHRFLQPSLYQHDDKERLKDYSSSSVSSSSSPSSSDSESSDEGYDDEDLEMDEDSNIDPTEERRRKQKKHHRHRRRLGEIIYGASGHNTRKKTKEKKKRVSDADDPSLLDPAERRRRQEAEEAEWMAEMSGRKTEISHQRGHEYRAIEGFESGEEEYESAGMGRSPPKIPTGLQKTVTRDSLPTTMGGSKSSLERFTATGRKSMDFAEIIVPSIAISLSPPPAPRASVEDDTDRRGRNRKKEAADKEREKRKMSPAKKLFMKNRDAFTKEKEVDGIDTPQETIDPFREKSHKYKEKDNGKIGRVKSRVEKIRSEVARVEDFIWRRDTTPASSPTASSFTESFERSDDDRVGRRSREQTFSGSEDEAKSRGRASLEVPEIKKPVRPTKHRSYHSTSYLPTLGHSGRNFAEDSRVLTDVETNEDGLRKKKTKSSLLLGPPKVQVSRDSSPVRSVVIESMVEWKKRLERETGIQKELPILDKTKKRFRPKISIDTAVGAPVIAEKSLLPAAHPQRVTKKDIKRARAVLLSSGIVARGITSRNHYPHHPTNNKTPLSMASLAKSYMYSSTSLSKQTSTTAHAFNARAQLFTNTTTASLQSSIQSIHDEISISLTPLVRSLADGADKLNAELNTTHTLAVKRIHDEVSTMMRRKRRRGRWIRRGMWALVEWAVLGVMWAVWIVFCGFRVVRGFGRGVGGALRWIFWI